MSPNKLKRTRSQSSDSEDKLKAAPSHDDDDDDEEHVQRQSSVPKTRQPHRIIDTILGEAQDLVYAAAEAQALGRLKMANSYLVLAHARLVGIGKRLDRQRPPITTTWPPEDEDNSSKTSINTEHEVIQQDTHEQGELATEETKDADLPEEKLDKLDNVKRAEDTNPVESDKTQPAETHNKENENSSQEINEQHSDTKLENPKLEESTKEEGNTEVAKALASLIPKGITLDADMMEHLAKAAMELHNQREASSKIAWTESEKHRCREAVDKFGHHCPSEIAKAVGTRTQQQVIAHLRNASDKARASRELDDELEQATADEYLLAAGAEAT